jgi:XTP/dITP diphosphohydrolase
MLQAVVIATGNAGKVCEFCAILKDSVFSFYSSKEIGFLQEIEENAQTFKGNAKIKAHAVFEYAQSKSEYQNCWVVADDSGLEVEALGERPGIFSARYAGENATAAERYAKLLKELEGASNRNARFVCCLCLMRPGNEPEFFEGECRGSILPAPKGLGGFGYDPVFLPKGYSKGFGEMSDEEKNALSHRGRAIKNMMAKLNAEVIA